MKLKTTLDSLGAYWRMLERSFRLVLSIKSQSMTLMTLVVVLFYQWYRDGEIEAGDTLARNGKLTLTSKIIH